MSVKSFPTTKKRGKTKILGKKFPPPNRFYWCEYNWIFFITNMLKLLGKGMSVSHLKKKGKNLQLLVDCRYVQYIRYNTVILKQY